MSPQPLARVDLGPRYSALDASLPEQLLVSTGAIALVRVELCRALAWTPSLAAHGGNGIKQHVQQPGFVDICRSNQLRERDAAGIDHKMTLRTRLAAVRRIRAGLPAPLFAGTVEASIAARLQLSFPALRSRLSSSCWSRSPTPVCCQSRRRRQQVIPLPQPSSWGSISQGMPLRSAKMMPARHARLGTRGLPPFGFGGSGGSSGWRTAHNSSGTRGIVMPRCSCNMRFC